MEVPALPTRAGEGHCIGLDPYYLTHKAQAIGYDPEVILAGCRINDGMGSFFASELIKVMLHRELLIKGARVLVLGLTFKENCPDLRNTRVVGVIKELREYNVQVDVHDPWASPQVAEAEERHQPYCSTGSGHLRCSGNCCCPRRIPCHGRRWYARSGQSGTCIV
ncbi:UDP binding domain-containing protein [Haliea sp.]